MLAEGLQFRLSFSGRSRSESRLHRDHTPTPSEAHAKDKGQSSKDEDKNNAIGRHHEKYQSSHSVNDLNQFHELLKITHVAKNVAVPIVRKDGPIKINKEATHAAIVQRKRIFRSRALK
jgi:hypothetical protein